MKDLAYISTSSGSMKLIADKENMFANRLTQNYKFQTVEAKFLEGKAFTYANINAGSFKVSKAGYVFLLVPGGSGLASYPTVRANVVADGWIRIFNNWNQMYSLPDPICYYVKWCEAGETYSYGQFNIAVAASEFNTNLTGWSALGGSWTVTENGLKASNNGSGDQFYMSNTSVQANQSWVYEADVTVEQGGAGGLIFGAKDPANPTQYLFGVNSDKGAGEFKHYKGGVGVAGWYEGISYGELADTNAYHFRVEYDVENSLITYKIAPYGTEDYVITQTREESELATYDGKIYFGLVTCWANVTYDNVNLYTK